MMKGLTTVIYIMSLNAMIASSFGSAPSSSEPISPPPRDEMIKSPDKSHAEAKFIEELVQEMLLNPHFSTPEKLKGAVPKNIRRFLKDPHKWSDHEIIEANKERRRQQLGKK
jgi:hypothetical protein